MADLRATFEADFASFYDACKQAVVELKSFETGASQVEDKLDRMTNKFSGQKVIQDAQLMTEAIERLGGVSTLTEAELARVGKVANEAVEKMRAIGMDVPKGMQELADATKNAGNETESLTAFVGKMAASYITAEAAIALVESAYHGLVSSIEASIKAASDAEEIDAKLLAALRAQGTAVPSVIEAYDQYAQALQATTKFSDDAVKAAEAVLVQIGGVMPKDMQRAVQATADLATALGTDLTSAATMVAKAAEGQTTALGKAGVVIKGTADGAASFTDVLDQLEAKLHGAAEAAGDTFAGSLAKLTNAWDNVLEATGRVIVTNQTWHDLVAGITEIVTGNTTELNQNAAATNLVSDAVILLAKGAVLLADGLEALNGEIRDDRIFFNELLNAVDKAAIGFLELTRASEAFWAAISPGAAGELARANIEEIDTRIANLRAHMEENTQAIADATETSATWSTAIGGVKTQLQALETHLETTRGQTRGLTTDAKENSDVWTMVTENLKASAAAADEAAKASERHQKAVAELESVSTDFHATVAGLNPELVEVVKHYLDAGVAAGTLAEALNLTAAQVAAITQAHKEELAQLKANEAYAATVAKLHLELQHAIGEASHDSAAARIADEQAWGEAQKRVLDKAHQNTAETYALIDAIVNQSTANMEQAELEADEHTHAHYQLLADEAAIAYDKAMAHADQYTQAHLNALAASNDAAQAALLNWQSVDDALDKTTQSAAGTAAAIHGIGAAFQSVRDLAGTGGTVPGGGNNANVTPWYDDSNFTTMMLNKSYQESGIAFAPGRASGGAVSGGSAYVVGERGPELFVPGAGGGTIVPHGGGGTSVVIQAGAFVFQYPIMNDPTALDALSRTVGDALVRKLSGSGLRL